MSFGRTGDGSLQSATVHRLRGKLDGVECTFDLTDGEHRVGRSPSNDIRLNVGGVSREHAVLQVTPGGLVVEDQGSKNGTFVNLSRVDRSGVPVGAILSFGPAELEVEVVDAEDVELALKLDPGPGDAVESASRRSQETTTFFDRSVAEASLGLVEGFAERLFATPRGEATDALGYLVEALGAAGSCLVEWIGGDEPVVLAAYGQIGELTRRREMAGREKPSFATDGTVSRTALSGGEKAPLELCVWGDFKGRSENQTLQLTLLRLLDRTRAWKVRGIPGTAAAKALPSHAKLVFPNDYQPGVSRAMTALYRQMRTLAKTDAPVLITGETGVGKERLAQILHLSSARHNGPFLALNCAAIPADLLEAELFGIGKGVATGVEPRSGKFQLADGGTLLLDEIGEMLPALQAKLLRALQEKQIQPVGGEPKNIDVRILAVTNADLDQRMDQGEFRRDLYFRLAGLELEAPPLRECTDDIPRLIDRFLSEFARESGIRLRGVTLKAFLGLLAYPWPGNVRQLQHEIRRLVYMCSDGDVIDARKLSRRLLSAPRGAHLALATCDDETLELEPHVRQLEHRLICAALRKTEGRQAPAARFLGIARNTLREKIKQLDLDPRDFRPTPSEADREEP